jgi:FMN phosphatase YigB (HAD superfamily)
MLLAVTFDFWNTVMWEEPGSLRARRLELWSAWLAERDVHVPAADLERAHDAAHFAYEDAWKANRQFRVEQATERVLAELGDALPDGAERMLLDAYDEAGRRAAVQPCDGVHACLTELKEAGVKLGIVCDIGLTPSPVVRELMAREGLHDLFDDMTFSDRCGFYKPAPEAFRAALDGLGGVPPDRAAHIGDRRRTDVAGAQGAGMTAVRYTAVYDDQGPGPDGDVVLGDLRELPAALRVAVTG